MSVSILGTGITAFGRRPADTLRSLSEEVLRLALVDAGIEARDLDMVVYGNATEGYLHGQEMIRAEVALRNAGLVGVPMINVENACASSSSAFHVACMAVSSGTADVVLVLGVERLTHPTKRRTFDALATAVDLHEHDALASAVGATGAAPGIEGASHSPLMDLYAAKARSFMQQSEITDEDLALVSVKNRFHGSLNPHAQFQSTVTVEEVTSSRMISDPLRMLMCSPVGDGAAAVIVASSDYVRRAGKPDVRVAGWSLTSNGAHPRAAQPVARAMERALGQSGLSIDNIDVVEVHDACAPAELWLYEEIGLCKPGDASTLIRSGATRLGGTVPVNVGGGLLGRGHPLGATGCAQLVELADQLRGRGGDRQVEGARVGLAQNSGGILDDLDEAVAAVTILVLEG
jgi:acetyl-CoA acetyltransferase